MSHELVIRTAGAISENLYLSTGCSACGQIRGGISMRLGKETAGFVASWEDFEAAYAALKAARETETFARFLSEQVARYGPGLPPLDGGAT